MGIRGYRNQTELHEGLTKATFNYLHNICTQRGLVWRQEHAIHNGMRPDAIGFCSLQYSQRKLHGLIGSGVGQEESIDLMFVFETKISYADYKSSFNGSGEWKEKPYANFHYLVVPHDFSKAYDLKHLPEYWGILEQRCTALGVIKYPTYCKIERSFLLEAAYTILFKWGRTFNRLTHQIESGEISLIDNQ